MTFARLASLAVVPLMLIQVPGGLAEEPAAVRSDHAARIRTGTQLFREHVRPALEKNCLECHGGGRVKGDFDLGTRESLVASGMVDESAEDSHMLAVLTHAEEPHMPLDKPKLDDATLEHIRRWIDLGAPYDRPLVDPAAKAAAPVIADADRRFWSFAPLHIVSPPAVADPTWERTAIDRFILARLESQQLQPNPPADRRVLIRRATFDLLGLPPTPEDVEAFVADPDPHAYERLLDRLLESPHYGERWARHWMDVARFAESHGYEQDYDRQHAYPYRDFLIRALNDDMPLDQFLQWQLAGDEFAPDDPWALAATGFLGAGAFPTQLTEAEFESARYDELDDMVATTGAAMLGLTVGCARCHDHKFDPIPSEDYYRVAAAFTTTIRSEIELDLDGDGKPEKVQVTSEGLPPTKHHADGRGFPHFYPQTYVLARGDVHQKKEEAQLGFLRVLTRHGQTAEDWFEPPPDDARTSHRRAALARWLTDTQHGAGHLAARVLVNRVWQHHFGRGIVATPNDFGLQGTRPTHPELLDWLATDLIHHGWRLKRLHKLIMTSSVYMQGTQFDERRAAVDRENQFWWRREPRRLEAEAIRDALLAVSGRLDTSLYGPGTLDESMERRSIYFFIKRSKLIPMMMLFDWPEHLVSIGRRSETTTAPQALLFMNSPQGRKSAEAFAARLEHLDDPAALIRAYRLAFGRAPAESEENVTLAFLDQQQQVYRAEGKSAADARGLARSDMCQALLSMNEFIYVE